MKSSNPLQKTLYNQLTRTWKFLTKPHPSITDIGEQRQAQLLSILSLILSVLFLVAILFRASSFLSFLIFLGFALGAYISSRTKYYRLGAYLFSFGISSIAFINIYNGSANSISSSISMIVPIALILASTILPQTGFLFLALAVVGATASLNLYADPKLLADPEYSHLRIIGITFSIGFLLYGITLFRESLERARLDKLQEINRELNELTASLEKRVQVRTRALETSAEVSRRLSTVLDPNQLASEVVNEVREAFDYYYAQIYLLDKAGENAVITSGTGEAGAIMLASGHRIPVGRGLVGRAADENTSVLVPDVSQEEGWLPNELLPETKTEAAVPISIGEQVLGVLDVQHNQVNRLTAEDVTLLESIAGQVAITLQNSRLYEESRKQVELESLVNVIGQKIQRATTMEDTLQTAIRELGTAIGATRVKATVSHTNSDNTNTQVA